MARKIPNAQFSLLDSENHILQPDEPAWARFCAEVLDFTGAGKTASPANLTEREEAILAEICAAKSNKDIARTLGVSEKTVRNHATNIFAKLGVSSRQEAILKMQDHS